MLVTEYAHIDRQWNEIRQYYRFSPELPQDDNQRPPRDACPGCGRRFSVPVLRTHECLGGSSEYPRIAQTKVRVRLNQDPDLIRQYIQSRRYPTVVRDE